MTPEQMTAERALAVLDEASMSMDDAQGDDIREARAFFAEMVEGMSAMRNDAKTHGMPLPANPEPQP
jgi:hypothetical protein